MAPRPNPVESTQQKIMMYGMPIMFGVFSFVFPSGLTLYILTNTFLRTGHQLYLNRTDEDRIEAIAKKKAAKAGRAAEPAKAAASESDAEAEAGVDAGEAADTSDAGAPAGSAKRPPQKKRGKKKKSRK